MSSWIRQFPLGRVGLVAFAAAAASTALVPSSGAAQPPFGPMDGRVVGKYAERFGVSRPVASERLLHQAAAGQMRELVAERTGDRFAGSWIDASGNPVFAYAPGTAAADILNASGQFGLRSAVTLRPVRNSLDELIRAQAQIDKKIEPLFRAELALTAIDEPANAVQILLSELAPSSAAKIAETAAAAALVAVKIQRVPRSEIASTPAGCSPPNCTNPIRAGVHISSDLGAQCSAGFIGTAPAFNSYRYVLTAGHCAVSGGAEWNATSPNNGLKHLGQVTGQQFGADGDYAKIRIQPGGYWDQTPLPGAFAQWGTSEFVQVAARRESVVGEFVCRYGARTQVACGVVTRKRVSGIRAALNGTTYTVNGLTQASMCARPGDSGGPVVAPGNVAVGLVSMGTETCAGSPAIAFQEVVRAEAALGVQVTSTSTPTAPDLYAIGRRNTGSGRTEAHVLSGATVYNGFNLQIATALHATDSTWHFVVADYNADGYKDIIAIATANTGSGMVEFHVLNGASNFTTFLTQVATTQLAFGPETRAYAASYRLWSPTPDIVQLTRNSSGQVYATCINPPGAPTCFVNGAPLPLTSAPASGWEYKLGDYNGDGDDDLYVVMRSNTGSGRTEVHVLKGPYFDSWLLHVATPVQATPSSAQWDFALGDADRDTKPDLYVIAKSNTGSGTTETHILSGATNYTGFLAQKATPLSPTNADWSFEVR